MDEKLAALQNMLLGLKGPLIAYSGGVDSSLLLNIAHDLLGDRTAGLIVLSPTLPERELEQARQLARDRDWPLFEIESQEMALPSFTANPPERCYYCKEHRFRLLNQFAAERGYHELLDGSNLDDQSDFRPGQRAAKEQGVRSPLQEAGFTKREIRQLAQQMGLPNWDKPSSACLASRIPYGTPITREVLAQIGQAEGALSELGFSQLRVRHHGSVARIEVPQAEFHLVLSEREKIIQALEKAGYQYITLDLSGFQTGSMNKGLRSHG